VNVLVIGGTRNLGPPLVEKLLAGGHRVAVFNRGHTPDTLPEAVERLRGDRGGSAQLERALHGRDFDAVVDTALFNGPEAEAVVQLLPGRTGHYVFISTGQVYLVREGIERPFREDAYDGPLIAEPPRDAADHEEWLYGADKRNAEAVFAAAWERARFPYTTLRLPMVNSERDHHHRLHGYLVRLEDGGPILVPDAPDLPLRHVYGGDVVDAIVRLVETGSGKGRVYNIAQDETTSLGDLLAIVGALLGVEPKLRRFERRALEARGLLPHCSPFSGRWMSELTNERSKAELGMRYTPLREVLARLVEHHRSHPQPPPAGYRQRRDELELALAISTPREWSSYAPPMSRRSIERFLAAILVCAAAAPVAPASPATAPAVDEGFIRQFAATYGFRLGRPGKIAIAPDGDVLFTRTPPRSFVADLYERDATTGEVRKVLDTAALIGGGEEKLSAEERARRERIRQATRGISGFELSRDGKRLLVPLSDRLFVVERAGVRVTELDTGAGFPYDPHLSAAGDRVAFVVDGDLWTIEARAGAKPARLTTRPGPDVENATAEFVAQEEMERTRGYWWSPDGGRIAYQQSDLSKVDTLWVANPARPEESPTPFRYPQAGRPNAEVKLGILPSTGGATTWVEWDHARWPYLTRVLWEKGSPLTLVVMNRAQTDLAILAADDRGATRTLLTEHDDAWLDLPSPELPRWLADGSGFLWATERRGSWQLELRRADGALERELTPTTLGMQSYAGFSDEGRVAWMLASADPIETHVWRVPLAGAATDATPEPGMSEVLVARSGGWVVTTTTPGSARRHVDVRRPDGVVAGQLPSVAEDPPWQPNVEWTTVESGGRDFHAAIVRPRAFDPSRKLPVIVHIYAGPTSQMVHHAASAYLLEQWYADAGFVVVSIDARGTPSRGRDWERAVHRDLITVALTDQADALRALGARYRELDLDRVGIYGWSFGGYAAAMAVILRPDVYRAAVAGAPVTDWKLYDTFYTERYMRTPQENPDGYARSSAIVHAGELTRPLLIVHGTNDDNVHFANSLELSQALFRAGKSFELLPVAATHMTPDPDVALAMHLKTLGFFREHL